MPFVDWSEVFHVENGSAIAPATTLGEVAVFTSRATLDLLLIAAVVQAFQLAARLSEQDAAFARGDVNILEPFGERRRFRQLALETETEPPAQAHEHPRVGEWSPYSLPRLEQIIRGGEDGAVPVQAEADEASRIGAMLVLRRQLEPPLAARVAHLSGLASHRGRPGSRLGDLASRTAVAGVFDDMAIIPAGEFWMGAADDEEGAEDNERPRRRASVPGFELSRYAVTFDQFDAYCDATGFERLSDEGWGRGRRPAINVSWKDICGEDGNGGYLAWLNATLGLTGSPHAYRLPSEAEWEYACRAGTDTRWSFGDDEAQLEKHAWFAKNSGGQTYPVGEKLPNPFGLYDMHGNVLEWCADLFGDYDKDPSAGSPNTTSGSADRVVRGGSWFSNPESLRSASRSWIIPEFRSYDIGFRLARSAPGN